MIKHESLSADWISARRKKYSKDPAIMEAMIYALYLLEHIKRTGLEGRSNLPARYFKILLILHY